MGGNAKTVTDDDFDSVVLRSDKPVLVDFWAEWCGPCRLQLPVLEDIAREYADRLTVAKINVDENPRTTAAYRVTSMPTMNVFKDGQVVHTIMGARPKRQLLAELEPFL